MDLSVKVLRMVLGASVLWSVSAAAHVGEHLYSSEVGHIVTIKPADYRTELKRLVSEGYDIAGVDPDQETIDLVVGSQQMVQVEQEFRVVNKREFDPKLAPDAGYTTHAELTTILQDYATRFPEILKIESIGKSHEKRDIWAVKISDNVQDHESGEPAIFFNAMHHAREVMTTEVALDLIESLTKGYSTNQKTKHWVDSNEIWIVPMVNPDGNNKVWTANSMWRKNTRDNVGVDINRNYPYKWGACGGSSGATNSDTYRGPSAGSEPETQAMMGHVARTQPVLSISYHSYSELVIYPYGCDGSHTPDREVVETVGKQLAGRLPKDGSSGTYKPGTSWEILYAVDGGDIDWYYAEHDVIPYVIEVNSTSQGFQPPFTWRQRTVEKMRAGWSYMLDRLDESGIRGHIVGADGRPISSGEVIIESLAATQAPGAVARAWRVKADGSFHILKAPGMYRLKVMSDGKTWEQDVTVGAERVDLEVTLN